MSLQVPDSRSRGRSSSRSRSKSRSHSRPRSQSRSRSKSKSRSKSRSRDPSTSRRSSYRDSDPAVDRVRARSRSRSRSRDPRRSSGRLSSSSVALGSAALGLGGSTVSSGSNGSGRGHRRSKSGYDGDGLDGDWDQDRDRDRDGQRRRRRRRHSYLKDENRSSTKGSRSNSASSSDSDADSVDDRLAYGDMPGSRKSSSKPLSSSSTFQSLLSALPRASDSMLAAATSAAAMSALSKREDPSGNSNSNSNNHGRQPSSPGAHPSYARPEPYRYANPMQYLQSKPQSPSHSQNYSGYNASPSSTSAPPLQVPPGWAPIPDCEQPGFVPPSSQADGHGHGHGGSGGHIPGAFPGSQYGGGSYSPAGGLPTYASPPAFQYAQVDPNIKYSSKNSSRPLSYPNAPQYANIGPGHGYGSGHGHGYGSGSGSGRDGAPPIPPKVPAAPSPKPSSSNHRPRASTSALTPIITDPQLVEISPGGSRKDDGRHRRHHSHSVSSVNSNNLSVAQPDPMLRPSSPLQEPYQGTYQSISPMPSPIVPPSKGDDDDISDSDLLGRSSHRRKKSRDDREHREGGSSSKRDSSRVRHHDRHESGSGSPKNQVVLIEPGVSQQRHVSFYNPTSDAIAMQEALSHVRHIDHKTLIRILPRLSSDDMLDLRKEYKRHVKIHGKGINIAKHINLKLGSNTPFGKACYATALGRWESEAYWANCYYQSGSSRRELLIESLMGRTNSEIHAIKECFRDPRYMDSLERCMRAELKADKFRMAVLMALEEERQSEREPLDDKLIDRDMYELHRALVSREGGESAMIAIIVRRSDAHLREVLREYEHTYRHNFAKAMIAKSPNLVGETLAHILNGVINRPMRDAMLLHQALRESRTGRERSELLISRLVRLHWEPKHLEQVKQDFRKRYHERLEEAIAEEVLPINGGSEWGEFCIALARSSST